MSLRAFHRRKSCGGLAWKPYMDWRQEKETRGKYTWTIALFGTGAMAREAKLSEKAYCDQIIRPCFFSKKNPIREWKKVYGKLEQTRKKLNSLPIEKLHVK